MLWPRFHKVKAKINDGASLPATTNILHFFVYHLCVRGQNAWSEYWTIGIWRKVGVVPRSRDLPSNPIISKLARSCAGVRKCQERQIKIAKNSRPDGWDVKPLRCQVPHFWPEKPELTREPRYKKFPSKRLIANELKYFLSICLRLYISAPRYNETPIQRIRH